VLAGRVNARIASQRTHNQRIASAGPRDAAALVAWFGAVQAQDYPAARWALGLRMPDGATAADIDRAVDSARLVRTHVLRPTWHFVAAPDVHWMLELTAARVQQKLAYAYRYYELDAAMRVKAARAVERAVAAGVHLTRDELGAHLAEAGVAVQGVRLALLTIYAELERVICSGRHRGAEATYALMADRAPKPEALPRDEAIAELTKRYFRSHGPATIRDFVWWSGLTAADAKRGVDIVRARSTSIDGYTYWSYGAPRGGSARRVTVGLLPRFDEYLVAYRDLDAVPRGRGALEEAIVVAGQVAGTWRARARGAERVVEVKPQRRFTDREWRGISATAARYGRFLELRVEVRAAPRAASAR